MDHLLKEVLLSGDTALLERYIDKYLPPDQKNLKRICQQLQQYEPINPHEITQQKQFMRNIVEVLLNKNFWKKKHSTVSSGISKSKQVNSGSSQHIKRSQSAIRLLKTKGINPKIAGFHDPDKQIIQHGRQIFKKECQRLVFPMHPNIQARFLHKTKENDSKLKQLFTKYELNRDLYENNEEEEDDKEKFIGFTHDMTEFLDKRKELLENIENHKDYEQNNKKYNKYSTIRSRVYSAENFKKYSRASFSEAKQFVKSKPSTAYNTLRSSATVKDSKLVRSKSSLKTQKVLKNDLVDSNFVQKFNCLLQFSESEQQQRIPLSISKESIKKIVYTAPKNIFVELEEKISAMKDENTDINQKTKKTAHKQFLSNYYDRYSRDYVKMLRVKESNCKFNKYQRDLLLDANKKGDILE